MSADVFNTAVSCFQSMQRLPSVSKSFCFFLLTPLGKIFAPQYCKLLQIVFLLTVHITECSENASESTIYLKFRSTLLYNRQQNKQKTKPCNLIPACLASSLIHFQHVAAHKPVQTVIYYFMVLKVITTQKRDNSQFLNQQFLRSNSSAPISFFKIQYKKQCKLHLQSAFFCSFPNKKVCISSTEKNQKGRTMPHSVNSQIHQAQHIGKRDVKMTATSRILKLLSIQITLLLV